MYTVVPELLLSVAAVLETSGDMTFNGGNIIVRPYGENDSPNGAGAGIGGGHAGCGTTFTFNGGSIDSIAAYHSAGIGGGCTYGGGMSTGGRLHMHLQMRIYPNFRFIQLPEILRSTAVI